MMQELMDACAAAEIPLYGDDFLCRTLAIIFCYGGGPGGEYFRTPVGKAVVAKAAAMLEKAVRDKDRDKLGLFRTYVRELREDRAPWLKKTLYRLNIPAEEISFKECW